MGKELFNPHLRKFSIRKLNIGVCSVLLATLVSVGTMTTANADENTALEDGTNELVLPKDKPQTAEVAASEVTTAATETVTAEAEQSAPQDLATTSEVATTPTSSTETSSPASNTTEEVAANSETSETASETPAVRSTETTNETPATTSENSEAPVATSSGLQDATSTPKADKPDLSFSERKLSRDLMKQVSWLEFGNKENFENLASDDSFQVGTVYKKEIAPGYIIKLTVTELKPFNSTEIYKNRVAGTGYENTYNSNAENTWLTTSKEYGKSTPKIVGASQNRWTAIKSQGIDTQGRKTQIQVPVDSANYGMKFKVEATYNGKPVKAAIVMADGEEANPGEFAIFTTNGTGWEYLAEWTDGTITDSYQPMDQNITKQSIFKDTTVHWQSYVSPDQATGGLGSQVFGPNISKNRTVPLVMTRDASEIGFYVASSGQQAAMIGVMVIDEGDAPESYGISPHMISTTNALTGVTTHQPYLGSVAADVDIKNKHDWQDDDKKDAADEGLTQLLSTDQLSKVNELFNFDLPEDGSYTLKVKASANGNSEAYMRAWIDFNQNGKFDDGEASDVVRVTETGDYTLTFTPDFSSIDKNIDRLGVRVRIALNQGDIEKPIGVAFSGEVEDLQILRTFPPKGDKQVTYGFKGESQTGTVHFTANGVISLDYSKQATIDSTREPQVIATDGSVLQADGQGWYNLEEGRYKLTTQGDNVQVVFEPNADFTGTIKGLNIRRYDSNGASSNWQSQNQNTANVNDALNNMDGRFIPTILKYSEQTSTDVQGVAQTKELIFNDGISDKTPVIPDATHSVQFLNASGNPVSETIVMATSNGQTVGTYELNAANGQVTFKPNKTFTGTTDPITFQLTDADGVRHRASYQATVTPLAPSSQNVTSEGIQGATQTGTLVFTSGDQRVPIDDKVLPTFDNGSQTKKVENVGTYTVDAQGKVTFQPLPSYTGRPDAQVVTRVDVNGTSIQATYQAEVKEAIPSAQNTTSTGLQGQAQSGHLTFSPGQAVINGETQKVDFNSDGLQFVINGQPQTGNALKLKDAQDKLLGVYILHPNGDIQFQPALDYVGVPEPARVRATDLNGRTVEATYSPTITAVTPTGSDATSTGQQGQVQMGRPEFTAGDPSVPLDDTVAATFDDGSQRKEVPNVGVFTVASDGTVTFTPVQDYVGTPDAITVKRVDKNGTPVTARYTATVTAAPIQKEDRVVTEDVQGKSHVITPVFDTGNPSVPIDDSVAPTFEGGATEKIVSGEGTYVIDSTGTITFTPEANFVGEGTGVRVVRKDTNGKPVTIYYTPTVTAAPKAMTTETTGKQG
ncbi:MAG: CshA/CshB family fibrillar adhesin-related protein, partial [Streptococcus sp.]|nr:CshA/CshB family fibrillar adhesin-related protein [Streptococcus sp.]